MTNESVCGLCGADFNSLPVPSEHRCSKKNVRAHRRGQTAASRRAIDARRGDGPGDHVYTEKMRQFGERLGEGFGEDED